MEVLYVACPHCSASLCLGGEYRDDPTLLCHCSSCGREFPAGEGTAVARTWASTLSAPTGVQVR